MTPAAGLRTVVVAAFAMLLAGCPRGAGGGHDGHDHDGHDHGHGHGEHDGHGGGEGGPGADRVRLDDDAARRAGVRVRTATAEVLVPTLTAPARVAADGDAVARVGAPVAGRIVEVRVRRGDRVAAGDVLLVIESPDLGRAQADYLAALDSRAAAAPAAEAARRHAARARAVHSESRAIPLSAVEDREAAEVAALAALAASEAAAEDAARRLSLLGVTPVEVDALARSREMRTRVEVRAPLAGAVIARNAAPGEMVGPGGGPLVEIVDPTWVWVIAAVPETRIREVAAGGAVRVTSPAAPDRSFDATVRWIAPHVHAGSRTVEVRADLRRDATGLLPGMYAEAEIAVAGPAPAAVVAVPAGAVLDVGGEPSVFVAVADTPGTYARRAVRAGPPVRGRVPILEGLAEGEAYVAEGAFTLKAELGKATAEHAH